MLVNLRTALKARKSIYGYGVSFKGSLREKCPNTEFFLVRIFPHSDQKKLRIWTLFTQWLPPLQRRFCHNVALDV